MKTLTSKYITVLAILTVVILGSQILMQKTIKDSETDSRIINISGRQRMLSQKITKASLKLSSADSDHEFVEAKKELKDATKLWSQSHIDLKYGSAELDVEELNKSTTLNQLFEDIEPLFKLIKKSSDYLVSLELKDLSDSSKRSVINAHIGIITANEADFLKLMNKITFQYDHLASAKIDLLSNIEYYLLGFTLILIILEVFFIFRPMFRDSKRKEKEIHQLNSALGEEKTFAANQINQANKLIRDLKKIARSQREELEEKQKEYTLKTTEQMSSYLKISGSYKELQNSVKLLREENEELKAKLLVK